MHARAVDDAGVRLRELRREEWQDLALAGVVLGLSLAATQGAPRLALPLFVGAVAVAVLGIRALWRRWDLVDRLAGEPEAYSIAEVLAYAGRTATMERRRVFAALIRHHLEPAPDGDVRLDGVADDLELLADELEDESLDMSPSCAVACWRLVSDPAQSPLLDPQRPLVELRSALLRIQAGFTSRLSDDA
jgi:hypothetical protein